METEHVDWFKAMCNPRFDGGVVCVCGYTQVVAATQLERCSTGPTLREGRQGEDAGVGRLRGQSQASQAIHDHVDPQHLWLECAGSLSRLAVIARLARLGKVTPAGAADGQQQQQQLACTAVSGDSVATIAPVTAVATATRLMVSWNCSRGAEQSSRAAKLEAGFVVNWNSQPVCQTIRSAAGLAQAVSHLQEALAAAPHAAAAAQHPQPMCQTTAPKPDWHQQRDWHKQSVTCRKRVMLQYTLPHSTLNRCTKHPHQRLNCHNQACLQEARDVAVHVAPPQHRRHDGRKVVVQQHDVGGLLGGVGACVVGQRGMQGTSD